MQIVRKGSEKLRMNARVVVVSYDLVAVHDAVVWVFMGGTAGRCVEMCAVKKD